MYHLWRFEPGQRIATVEHTDLWWQGDRYGKVTKVGTKYLHVQMDSGRKRKFVIEGRDGFDPRVSSLRPVRRNEL